MSKFKEGDRVTASGVVIDGVVDWDGDMQVRWDGMSGGDYRFIPAASLRPGLNDPEGDPLGTTRVSTGARYVKTSGKDYPWVQLEGHSVMTRWLSNAEIVDSTIIGYVPEVEA